MLAPVISFIIPYSERDYCSDDGRLSALLEQLSGILQTEVVVHTTGQLSSRTEEQLTALESIKWVKGIRTSLTYSAGQARNEAVSEALGEYLFFIDIDLVPTPCLLTQLTNRAIKLRAIGNVAFEMFPCIYLNQQGTQPFDGDFDAALDSFLKGENGLTDGIALASSCLLVNREWFNELKGFNPQFVGHGGEDLELIHRLCLHYSIAEFFEGYHQNKKSQHPANYDGFRRSMACYALPHLFEGRFLVHKWHPRPLTTKYHKARAQNDQLLEIFIKNSLNSNMVILNEVASMSFAYSVPRNVADSCENYQGWIKGLQLFYGFSPSEYPGLFKWNNQVKIKRSLYQKLRKFYLNPKLFLSDMIKNISSNSKKT